MHLPLATSSDSGHPASMAGKLGEQFDNLNDELMTLWTFIRGICMLDYLYCSKMVFVY